jgi:acetyl-CoA C-acetyltransferase
MKPHRAVYILGGAHTRFIGKYHPDFLWKGHPDFGKRKNPTIEEHLRSAALDALAATGVKAEDIERGFVGNFAGECFARQAHLGAVLAGAHPGLARKPHARLEGACASGGLAVAAGVDAIAAGAELVLVVGVEVQTTVDAREGADYLARAADYSKQRAIDPFTFPCLFARRARAYREAYGVDPTQIAAVVVKAHHNAARNPHAHLHAVGSRMTLERASRASPDNPAFLENPEYRDFLTLADCSPISDGASAIVLASEEALRSLGRSPAGAVRIAGMGIAADALSAPAMPGFDLLHLSTTAAAADAACRSAGVRPEAIQVAEVHDCFSIAEVLMTEALGFAPAGGGAALAASGATAIGGRIPINTGGGLIGFGHPVGATGVKQALENFRQLTGQAGDYQVRPVPRIGLSANMGGDDRTAVVTVYRRE